MAKFKPMELISETRGRISQKSKFAFKKMYDTQFTQEIVPSSVDPTTNQIATRTLFKQVAAAVKTQLADATEKAALLVAFRAQKKYPSLRGFAFAQKFAELKAA